MTPFRAAGALAVALTAPWSGMAVAHADAFAQLGPVPVTVSPTCGGSVSAEAQVTPVQIDDHVEDGVRVAIHYDAGIYDGSCALTVTAAWANLDTGASGSSDITAVSTIDGHYGFVGYANTTFETGRGTVTITLSSHPGAALQITA
jgi:Rieske Fe-S protein